MNATAQELRGRLKLKYMGDCKCGHCSLVPDDLITRAANELDTLGVLLEAFQGYRITVIQKSSV